MIEDMDVDVPVPSAMLYPEDMGEEESQLRQDRNGSHAAGAGPLPHHSQTAAAHLFAELQKHPSQPQQSEQRRERQHQTLDDDDGLGAGASPSQGAGLQPSLRSGAPRMGLSKPGRRLSQPQLPVSRFFPKTGKAEVLAAQAAEAQAHNLAKADVALQLKLRLQQTRHKLSESLGDPGLMVGPVGSATCPPKLSQFAMRRSSGPASPLCRPQISDDEDDDDVVLVEPPSQQPAKHGDQRVQQQQQHDPNEQECGQQQHMQVDEECKQDGHATIAPAQQVSGEDQDQDQERAGQEAAIDETNGNGEGFHSISHIAHYAKISAQAIEEKARSRLQAFAMVSGSGSASQHAGLLGVVQPSGLRKKLVAGGKGGRQAAGGLIGKMASVRASVFVPAGPKPAAEGSPAGGSTAAGQQVQRVQSNVLAAGWQQRKEDATLSQPFKPPGLVKPVGGDATSAGTFKKFLFKK